MKKIFLLAGIFALLNTLTIQAQVTVGKLAPPDSSAVFQVISPDSTQGVLIPEMTEKQRGEIKNPADGLMIYNIDEDCYNYWSKMDSAWQSVCGKMGKALFLPVCDSGVQVMGTYGEGVAVNSSNFIKIYVNVTKMGTYSIQASSRPNNGYFYETSGTFLSTGGFWMTIPATGQPIKNTQGANLTDPADDTPDKFTLTSSSGTDSCTFLVNVMNTTVQPNFDISCGSILVQGAYFEDSVLTSKPNTIYDGYPNQISVQLNNIPASSFGAIAHLETNTVDGISFGWTGILTSSPQTVIMQGTGTPRGLNDKIMTITSNSVSNAGSCSATVSMLIPRKRMMTFGNATGPLYGYNSGIADTRTPPNNQNTMFTDKNNFGYNQWSIVRFAGFNNKSTAAQGNAITGTLDTWADDDRDIVMLNTQAMYDGSSASALRSYLQGTNGHRKIDIFMIEYNVEFADNATRLALARELVDFTHNGGILMIFSEQPNSNAAFMNLMFGYPTPAIISSGTPAGSAAGLPAGNGAGTNYTLGFNSYNTDPGMKPYYCKDDDPILAGPFNNILGRSEGEDASTTMYFVNIPLDSIIIYAGARSSTESPASTRPANGVTVFRHILYPFIFSGDGGFNSSEARSYQATASDVCPFQLTGVTKNGHTYPNYPYYRINFGGTGKRVDNTSFTANAFAWAIMQAEAYRRSHKQ